MVVSHTPLICLLILPVFRIVKTITSKQISNTGVSNLTKPTPKPV